MASMTTDQFLASFANMAPHQRSLPSLGSLEASLKTLLTFKALQDPTSFSTLLDNVRVFAVSERVPYSRRLLSRKGKPGF
jgi:hypothetical protein